MLPPAISLDTSPVIATRRKQVGLIKSIKTGQKDNDKRIAVLVRSNTIDNRWNKREKKKKDLEKALKDDPDAMIDIAKHW